MTEWLVEEPQTIDIEDGIQRLQLRLVGGRVDIVTTDLGTATVEVTDVDGPPVRISVNDGRLLVAHDDLGPEGVFGWVRNHHRSASVSIAVPVGCEVALTVMSADAVVAGIHGRVSVRSVSGEIVLDGIDGDVDAESVSGDVEARWLVGRLSFKTVSGELVLVEARPERVRAHSVSGDVVVDLASGARPHISINTVSGDATVRLPDEAGLEVDVASMSGELSSVFPGLSIETRPGRRRLTGRLGDGEGVLTAKTLSGSFALLSRRRSNGHPIREAS